MTRLKTTPAQKSRPEVAPRLAVLEKANSETSITNSDTSVYPGRSARFPTHYRVGSVIDLFKVKRDVYWQPAEGYAVEHAIGQEFEYLTSLTDLSGVEWFDRGEDLDLIFIALDVSGGGLMQAMGADLFDHVLDAVEDDAIAAEAEAEKESTLHASSGVF